MLSRRQTLALLSGGLATACGSPAAARAPLPASAPPTPSAPPTALPATAPTRKPATAPTALPATPTAAPATVTPQAAIATAVAATPTSAATAEPTLMQTGVDVLLRDGLPLLDGKAVGLLTNPTGRTRDGRSSIDALNQRFNLKALFSPEHGIRGEADAGQAVDSSVDAHTGLPVYSLYGNTTRPTTTMLAGLDVLVYDIQDVGARTYTYTSTLLAMMQAAAQHGVPVVVLDRPDPIGGDQVEGNVLDARFASFVGPAPIAMRYGMTIGELARFFNGELGVAVELTIVKLEGWQRSMWFDQTGLEWVNPSPNIRNVDAAALYAGMVLFEGTNLSEGRGTDAPFEWIGAPWIDAHAWLGRISADGVSLAAENQTPDASADKFAGQPCHGLRIDITDRQQLQPMALAVTMLATVGKGLQFQAATFDRLAGTDQLRKAIASGMSPDEIAASWQADLEVFRAKREPYLLY